VAESIVENNLRFLININDNDRFVRAERLNQKFPVDSRVQGTTLSVPASSSSPVYLSCGIDMIKEKGRRMKHGQ